MIMSLSQLTTQKANKTPMSSLSLAAGLEYRHKRRQKFGGHPGNLETRQFSSSEFLPDESEAGNAQMHVTRLRPSLCKGPTEADFKREKLHNCAPGSILCTHKLLDVLFDSTIVGWTFMLLLLPAK